MFREIPLRIYFIFFCGLLIANVFIYRVVFAPQVVTVSVLDVGKGGATLVRSKGGATVLIDTGGDASILRAVGGALPLWQKNIDVVILKNSTANAAGGIVDVLKRYQVTNLIRFGAQGSKSMEVALASAASAQTRLQQTTAPYGMILSLDADVSITISSPDTFTVLYGVSSLSISSTTPEGVYIVNGTH